MMRVFILGMHRSGTSVLARLINLMGVSLGDERTLMPPQPDNPQGFWEQSAVVDLNDKLLAGLDAAWDRPERFRPQKVGQALAREFRGEARAILDQLDAEPAWGVKDPRLCLTFPLWRTLTPEALCIISFRHPLRVALSLNRRNQIPVHRGLALWEYYNVQILEHTKGLARIFVDFQTLAQNREQEIGRLVRFLRDHGAQASMPRPEDLAAYLRYAPRRINALQSEAFPTPQQEKLWRRLLRAASEGQEPKVVRLSSFTRDILRGHSSLDAAHRVELAEKEGLVAGLRAENEGLVAGLRAEKSRFTEEMERQRLALQEAYEAVAAEHRRQIGALQKELADQRYHLHDLERFRREAQEALGDRSRDIRVLCSWLEQLHETAEAVSRSASWRLGNLPIRLAKALLGQPTDSAFEHARNVYADYLDWRKGLPAGSTRPPAARTRANLGGLLGSALSAPRLALSLLTWERLANFWTTLRSGDPELRARVFGHYIQMFSPKRTVPEPTPVPRSVPSRPLPKLAGSEPEVSIIIPVYNQWRYTRACLDSILDSGTRVSYEVILADDCSTDQTQEAGQDFPGLRVVRTPENLGFLRNCNSAAKTARGGFLVFLNNDTQVRPGWLEALLQVMEEDPEVAICGSKLVYPDGTLQEAGGIIWDDASGWNYGRLGDPEAPEFNYVKEVDYISGASIMVRRSFWEQAGGFDEAYAPAYYEDADLAFKARELGYKVVYTPFSVVVHFEGTSHGTDLECGIKSAQVRNREVFLGRWKEVLSRKHFPNGRDVFLARDRSRGKRTILVFDHYVPHFDQDAGSKTTFQYLRALARAGNNVKFIGENFFRHEPYTTVLQALGVEVFYGPAMAENWTGWVENNAPFIDLVIYNRPQVAARFADTCARLLGAPKAYYGHDLHFLRKRREYEISGNQEDLAEAQKYEKLESGLFRKMDVVLTGSTLELAILRERFPEVPSARIPIYALESLPPAPEGFSQKRDLLFVGGFRHSPNVDAVLWFVREVFPLLLEEHPDLVFWCVGSKVPPAVSELASGNVRILGEVSEEELQRLLATRRVSVAPLRFGAGVKGKIVEALASGILIAATSTALEGLAGIEDLVKPCDQAAEMAEEISRLLSLDESECVRLATRYREYAWETFSAQSALQALGQALGMDLKSGSGPSPWQTPEAGESK